MSEHLENLGEPVEIDGIHFRIAKLGYKAGRQVGVRLAKVLGPALADMADRAPSLAELGDQLQGFDPQALGILFRDLSDDDLEFFADRLGSVSRYSTDGGVKFPKLDAAGREALFSGRQFLALCWMKEALGVQFSDFLAALAVRSASAPAAEKKPSESTPTT